MATGRTRTGRGAAGIRPGGRTEGVADEFADDDAEKQSERSAARRECGGICAGRGASESEERVINPSVPGSIPDAPPTLSCGYPSDPDQIRVQFPMKKSDHRIPCLRTLRCLR